MDLNLLLSSAEAKKLLFATTPNKIGLDELNLDDLELSTVTRKSVDKPDSVLLPPLDFGIGFEFDIGQINLKNQLISFHQGQKRQPDKFDPDHLDLLLDQLSLHQVLIHEDTLGFEVDNLAGSMPGFDIETVSGNVHVGHKQALIEGLTIDTQNSGIELNAILGYQAWSTLLSEVDHSDLELGLAAEIQLADFDYFLKDSLVTALEQWETTELKLNGTAYRTTNRYYRPSLKGRSKQCTSQRVNQQRK